MTRSEVAHLHGLGPRALYEFLSELAQDPMTRADIEAQLGAYSRLDRDTLRAVGGHRFPPFSPYEIRKIA